MGISSLFGSKPNYTTVIAVDADEKELVFYSIEDGGEPVTERKKIKSRLFDKEFFEIFAQELDEYSKLHPTVQARELTVVLPDMCVSLDSVAVPTMRGGKSADALNVSLEQFYKNHGELKINTALAMSNKQYSTYATSVIRNDILTKIYSTCAPIKMVPSQITFESAAITNSVSSLQSKLKNSSYLLMDLKEGKTKIVFVVKGRTAGFYELPFGYEILHTSRLAAEDMIFDHSVADLVVLNAKEKARAKQLTMAGGDNSDATQMADALNGDDDEFEEDDPLTTAPSSDDTEYKTMGRKQARHLPKFMLRPTPKDDDGFIYENFRIFIKWALNLIAENQRITAQGAPEAVYVNLPPKYEGVFEATNLEEEENGIKFVSLDIWDGNESVASNLEIYGGLYPSSANKVNVF